MRSYKTNQNKHILKTMQMNDAFYMDSWQIDESQHGYIIDGCRLINLG